MELVDTRDLKSLDRNIVPVQVRPRVPLKLDAMNKNIKNEEVDDIDLKELFTIVLHGKYILISSICIAAILSIFYALSLPNMYTSDALLAEANQKSSLSSNLGSMSSLAGLAGISLPTELSKSTEAIERIKSFDFFTKYILPDIKLENLLAVDGWFLDEDIISYNNDIYNKNTNQWVRKTKPTVPSHQEAYSKYKKIMSISENNKTGFITLSVIHHSPIVAKKWVNLIIKNINASMRKENDELVNRSIDFLTQQAGTTSLKEIRDASSQLIVSQMHNLMTTAASESYVFRVIDSAIAPEIKTSPSRAIICIIGTILGSFIGLLLIFGLHFRRSAYDTKD